MLTIKIQGKELWDPKSMEFKQSKSATLMLEHSLISVSKWESKWKKPFLTNGKKTREEMIDYVRCMTLNNDVDKEIYDSISSVELQEILDYIESPMTATTIKSSNNRPNREIVTSEIIYYWMIENGIPFECQKWHLNRLIMLIRVCNEKNADPKKMSNKEILQQNHALNQARRKARGSKG